jgi:hypothetical protein
MVFGRPFRLSCPACSEWRRHTCAQGRPDTGPASSSCSVPHPSAWAACAKVEMLWYSSGSWAQLAEGIPERIVELEVMQPTPSSSAHMAPHSRVKAKSARAFVLNRFRIVEEGASVLVDVVAFQAAPIIPGPASRRCSRAGRDRPWLNPSPHGDFARPFGSPGLSTVLDCAGVKNSPLHRTLSRSFG